MPPITEMQAVLLMLIAFFTGALVGYLFGLKAQWGPPSADDIPTSANCRYAVPDELWATQSGGLVRITRETYGSLGDYSSPPNDHCELNCFGIWQETDRHYRARRTARVFAP